MIEVNTIVLENGIEYTEIDNLVYNNIKYVLLCNVGDTKDSCIRKISIEDSKEFLARLDDDREFDIILELFMKQNKTLFS